MCDGIHMIQQPLLTDEGFLNEACMRELEAAIRNMPKTYERLKNDPEWSVKWWTTDLDIVSSFAASAITCFRGVPPNLDKVCQYVHTLLRKEPSFEKVPNDKFMMAELSLIDINKMLWNYLGELPLFLDWNDSDKYETWADLDALLHNVCLLIRTDRREFDRFNEEFEREYGQE